MKKALFFSREGHSNLTFLKFVDESYALPAGWDFFILDCINWESRHDLDHLIFVSPFRAGYRLVYHSDYQFTEVAAVI